MQTVESATSAPCGRQRQALLRSLSIRFHLNRVPNLNRVVLVSCEDLMAVQMTRTQSNPIRAFESTISILYNIYGVIIDLNRCFQFFSA